jgi:hypothetical protein
LSLYNTREFDSIIAANQNIFQNINNAVNNQAIIKMREAFSQGFDVLTENNISINFKNIENLSYDKNDIIINNKRIPIEQFGQNLYKKLSLGVLNYSKLNSQKDNTYLQAESSRLLYRDISATQNLQAFAEANPDKNILDYTGFYKLTNNTFREAYVISFPVIRAQNNPNNDFYSDDHYALGILQYTNIEYLQNIQTDFLVNLDIYRDQTNNFSVVPYANIPVLNKYFIVSSDIAKITKTQSESYQNTPITQIGQETPIAQIQQPIFEQPQLLQNPDTNTEQQKDKLISIEDDSLVAVVSPEEETAAQIIVNIKEPINVLDPLPTIKDIDKIATDPISLAILSI